MSVEVDVLEAPNWLQQLEQQRERRLQSRLGHEAGAGAPCLNCNDKCPGLDLHFWRKICKICKCSKENHDIPNSDIHGWVQFELLGNKSNRTRRKIVLPGKKDELELEWSPKGQNETIEKYLKTLPPEDLPVKGSQAAQNRKQLLQKQIPVHDIDPTLCHELTPAELNQMNEYISHVKENSVGVGQIINLSNILKGNLHNIDAIEAALVANRYGEGLSDAEIVRLQASGMAKSLDKLKLNYPKQNVKAVEDESIPVNANQIRDINYAIYAGEDQQNRLKGQYADSPFKDRKMDKKFDQLNPKSNISNYNPQAGYNVFEDQMHNPENIRIKNEFGYMGSDPRSIIKNSNDPKEDQRFYQNFGQNFESSGLNKVNIKTEDFPKSDQKRTLTNYNPQQGFNVLEDPQNAGPRNQFLNYAPEMCYNTSDDLKNHPLPANPNLNYIENYYDDQTKPLKQEDFGLNSNQNRHYAPGNYNLNEDVQNPSQPTFKDIYENANEPIYQNVEGLQQSLKMTNNNAHDSNRLRNKQLSQLHPSEIRTKENLVQPQQVNIGAIQDIDYNFDEHKQVPPSLPSSAPPAKSLEDVLASIVLPNCHHCNQPFRQEDFAIPLDRSDAMYHANCFKCFGCNQLLADNVYFYDKASDQIYCGRDYAKIRGIPRCSACDELIFTKDYCLAQDNTYHIKHFCCFDCETPLAGQNYVLEDNQTFCLPCFEQNKADKCSTCKQVIKAGQEGATLKGLHFHVSDQCFACSVCKVPLVGKRLLLKNDKLYCSSDCYSQDSSV